MKRQYDSNNNSQTKNIISQGSSAHRKKNN